MAHVHTNNEDRRRDMADEQRKLVSLFDINEDVEPEELEPERKIMPFDEWQKLSKHEQKLFRDMK